MKTFKRIAFLSAVLIFASYQGFSQNATANQKDTRNAQPTTKVTPGKFVDANKDGVCDNYQARGNSGRGANFVDKNGDGICDNRGNAGKGKGNRNGCGMGNQRGYGNCGGGGCGNQRGQGQGRGNCGGSGNGYKHRHGQGN